MKNYKSARPISSKPARLAILVLLAGAHVAGGADVVYLSGEDVASGTVRRQGQVLEYTSRAIRIRLESGVERSFAARRVERIESDWLPTHRAADEAFKRSDPRQAIEGYRQAIGDEKRVWVRQLIVAQVVWCYQMLDQQEAAADTFILLIQSDPVTPYFDAIPLAWTPAEAISRTKAAEGMARDDSAGAQLLGASHMMASAERPAALRVLRRLAAHADPRVAALAEAQIWRSELVRADAQLAEVWSRRIEAMPAEVQSGPYTILGRALEQQQRWEEAALAYLHVPVLEPRAGGLAAGSLVAAGSALEKMGRHREAVQLFEEVVAKYGDTKSLPPVKARLESIQN